MASILVATSAVVNEEPPLSRKEVTRGQARRQNAGVSLAERIRTILTEQEISQRELSKRAGLAPGHVGHLLTGEIKEPSVDVLIKIATAGKVDPIWLIMGKGERRHLADLHQLGIHPAIAEAADGKPGMTPEVQWLASRPAFLRDQAPPPDVAAMLLGAAKTSLAQLLALAAEAWPPPDDAPKRRRARTRS